MDYTEGPAEDPLNLKKRKGTDNSTESEGEEQPEGRTPPWQPETREAHARAAEMTEMARVQANNVQLLTKALGIPEDDESAQCSIML